jgi:hypothetical protein
MSRSEIEELPEELRKILLAYIAPLNNAISELLHTKDDEDFERKFKDVMFELLKSWDSLQLALSEEHFNLLLTTSTQVGLAAQRKQTQTLLEQALADAIGVIANFIRLILEPNYQDHVPNHPGVIEPYLELVTYTAILIYILDNIPDEVEPSMAKKIIRKCQKTTSEVEDYVDTIEIDADHETSAALERVKQMSF